MRPPRRRRRRPRMRRPPRAPRTSRPTSLPPSVWREAATPTGTTEPLDAAQRAAKLNVPIYTIALGTPNGTVTVPDQFGQMHTLEVPPDTETLQQIAKTTGGKSFDAPTAE